MASHPSIEPVTRPGVTSPSPAEGASREDLKNYLISVGLGRFVRDVGRSPLHDVVEQCYHLRREEFTPKEVQGLYEYFVPRPLGERGQENRSSFELERKRYNLTEVFRLPTDVATLQRHPMTLHLWRLKAVIDELVRVVPAACVVIYRKHAEQGRERVLVKESSSGSISRAEFPLTEGFARHSNNSLVGLTGRAVLIEDVGQHEGPYYVCDPEVRSECCLPILNARNDIVGVLDAESLQVGFFTSDRVLELAQVCVDLGRLDEVFCTLEPATTFEPVARLGERSTFTAEEKEILYRKASQRILEALHGEQDVTAKMATVSCLLKYGIPYFFWVGFYCVHSGKPSELIVGPYQGTLGCVHIPFSKGVCGACARERRTVVVPDVHAFPGHISCDGRSRSEIVVPVFDARENLLAVFDVDSELLSAFDSTDQIWLERILRDQFST